MVRQHTNIINGNVFSQKCLSDSMMDMDAYLCVTDDVLHQIKALDSDKSAKIRKAKDIVERIERHDFFKLIKEKKVIMGNANRSRVCYYYVTIHMCLGGVSASTKYFIFLFF